MINKIFIILSSFFLSFSLNAQNLSVDDWLYDFNYLKDSVIESGYGKKVFVDKVLGEIYNKKVNELKNELLHCEDQNQAISVLERLLNLTLDGHSRLVSMTEVLQLQPYFNKEEQKQVLYFVDTVRKDESIKLMQKYWEWKRKSSFYFINFFKYENGVYKTFFPLKFKHKIIPIGTIISKINGIDINQYVLNNIDNIPVINYDYVNKILYSNYISNSFDPLKQSYTDFTFADSSNVFVQRIYFDNLPKLIGAPFLTINLMKVKYFRKDKVMYIRLFRMNESYKHMQRIRKIAAKKNVNRVIVDIRDNFGGNDLIWKEIFEELINVCVDNKIDVVAPCCNIVKQALPCEDTSRVKSFLGKDYYKLNTNVLETLLPSSTSINFKKKIVVIYNNDIFSSAGACAAIANRNSKFVTVGTPLNYPMGVGVTPTFIMLPKTGLIVQIDLTLDITNAKGLDDLFLVPDYEVMQSINDYYIWQSKFGNRWKWNFLRKHDAFYQKAISVNIDN